MPNAQFNPAQPLLAVCSPPDSKGESRSLEIGQKGAWKEAMFFASLGYAVSVAAYENGEFRVSGTYVQGPIPGFLQRKRF